MTFGINSADVMRHLLREDVCRTVQGVKKLPFTQRLPFHLWHQRSFYPLYPAGQKASGQPEIAVDLGRADQLNLGDHKPDCMIMCSKLNHFATVRCGGVVGGWCFVCGEVLIFVFLMFFFVLVVVVVVQDCENVLCINPGRLTKGVSGGTYARIVIQPYNAAKLENQEDSLQLTHDMTERAAVEVRWWWCVCGMFVDSFLTFLCLVFFLCHRSFVFNDTFGGNRWGEVASVLGVHTWKWRGRERGEARREM